MAKISIRLPGFSERIENIVSDSVTIGRGSASDIKINDPHLSRVHCRLERNNGIYTVYDCGSRNGLKVNDIKISESTTLTTGDFIDMGRTKILFVADNEDDRIDDEAVDAGQTIMLAEVTCSMTKEEAAGAKDNLRYVLQYTKGGNRMFLPLSHKQLTIGRHKSCGLRFKDKSVSSCHAAIEFKDGEYHIHDFGSTNGIHLNGKPIDKGILKPGTRIRIGNITLGFKEVVKRASTMMSPPSIKEQSATDTNLHDDHDSTGGNKADSNNNNSPTSERNNP